MAYYNVAEKGKILKDSYMLEVVLNNIKRGIFRTDHPLQRRPGAWSDVAKYGLIATIIKNEDIDRIRFCEQKKNGMSEYYIIDGLQRITIAMDYKEGIFKLGKNIEEPIIVYTKPKKDENGVFITDKNGDRVYEFVEYDLRGKGYADLPDELREIFDSYQIDTTTYQDCTNENVGYNIRRFNNDFKMKGSQQTITYMDNVAGFVKNASQHKFFKDCMNFTEKAKINGTVEKIVIDALSAINLMDNWNKNARMQGLLIETHLNKQHFDMFEEQLNRLHSAIGEKHQEDLNIKNAYLFLALFNLSEKLKIDAAKFDEFITYFMDGGDKAFDLPYSFKDADKNKVSKASYEELSRLRSTKDKKIVLDKLYVLLMNMLEFLGIELPCKPIELILQYPSDVSDKNDEIESKENGFEEQGVTPTDKPSDTDEVMKLNILNFVKENVNSDITEEDTVFYEQALDDLTLNVDNSTSLLEKENRPSLVAMMAYSFEHEVDLDDWLPNFFLRNHSYIVDQKENYQFMVNDFNQFQSHHAA